ncbi:hypothetical protein BH10PSE2_BH10PSE2_07480 [soil metagenome]
MPLLELIDEIEATALGVYAAHELPTAKGHYAWSKKKTRFRFLAEELTAEERWALILANSANADWQFGSLDQLGASATEAFPSLREASRLLVECRALRLEVTRGGSLGSMEILERAVRVGADWKELKTSANLSYRGNLKLSGGESLQKRPRRRKSAKDA